MPARPATLLHRLHGVPTARPAVPFGRCCLPTPHPIQLDTFLVDSMYLGGLAEVTMWHDGSGHQPHWYCEFVKVVCCKNGHAFNFPCG